MSRLYMAAIVLAVAAALAAAGCGKQGETQEITETRTLTAPKPADAGASSAERFGMTMRPAAAPTAQFEWTTPEGWTEETPNANRIINLRPAGDPKAECFVTLLGQSGGGVAANVNRWRGQMGLEPTDEAAIAALPKKPLLGGEAVFVELEGNYRGMGGDQDNPDFKMVGLILDTGGSSVFVKMTGPKALIDQELPKFEQFCASIKPADPHAGHVAAAAPQASGGDAAAGLPAGHPPIDPNMQPSAAAASSSLTWTAPAGWTQAPPRAMREVTFTMGADGKTECFVTKLNNMGGGVEANINRWAGQMGLPPLSKEALDALPKITILGKPGPMVELRGTYTDMSGNQFEEYTMMGAIGELGSSGVFIKLVGPSSEVEAQKSNFVAFCESLK